MSNGVNICIRIMNFDRFYERNVNKYIQQTFYTFRLHTFAFIKTLCDCFIYNSSTILRSVSNLIKCICMTLSHYHFKK